MILENIVKEEKDFIKRFGGGSGSQPHLRSGIIERVLD